MALCSVALVVVAPSFLRSLPTDGSTVAAIVVAYSCSFVQVALSSDSCLQLAIAVTYSCHLHLPRLLPTVGDSSSDSSWRRQLPSSDNGWRRRLAIAVVTTVGDDSWRQLAKAVTTIVGHSSSLQLPPTVATSVAYSWR